MREDIENELMSDFDPKKYFGIVCEKLDCVNCSNILDGDRLKGYHCQTEKVYIQKRYDDILNKRLKRLSEKGGF